MGRKEGRKKSWGKKSKKSFKIIFERGNTFVSLGLELPYHIKNQNKNTAFSSYIEPPITDEILSPTWIIRVCKNVHTRAYRHLHLFNMTF